MKGPFVKLVLLNLLLNKTSFDIGRFFHFRFFNIHIIQQAQLSMIHMPLKWHHIDKCNKNYKKVDILTLILACLSSSPPINMMY